MATEQETLAEAFWAVSRRLRMLTRETVTPLGITPGHARALVVLGRHGTMRPGELSDHLRIAPRSATEVVDALEEKGLVTRTPDPADRRATLIELSPAGTEVAHAVRAARAAEAEGFFEILDDADRAALERILTVLRNA